MHDGKPGGGSILNSLRRFFPARFSRGAALWSTLQLLLASITGQIIFLCAAPLITRIYTPQDFGFLAAFTAIFAALLSISGFRYELAIPLPQSDRDARYLVHLCLAINLCFSALLIPAIFLSADTVADTLNTPALSGALWLIPIGIIGGGAYRTFRFLAVRAHNFGAISRTRIIQPITNVAVQTGCGLAGLGAMGLAMGHVIGQSAGALSLNTVSLRELLDWRRLMSRRCRYLAKRYDRFPKFDVAAALIDTLSVHLPNLLLAGLFSPAVAGFYLLSERVLGAPMSMLAQAIGQVLYSRSRLALRERRLGGIVIRVLGALFLISVPAAVFLYFLAPPIFAFVFGESWRQAGVFASWLVFGLVAQFLYSSVSLSLMATDGQKVNFGLHLILLISKGAAMWLGAAESDAGLAIICLSTVNVVGYGAGSIIVLLRALRRDRNDGERMARQLE